ncbi:MAG: nucleotidyltransferase family protein, partial [Firmicutes bacterium]|nr:nucleotidyltransferase family protein [Candidatus Colimorpha enterica]
MMSFDCEKKIDNPDVYTYKKWFFDVELHSHIFYEKLLRGFDYKKYFDGVWEHCEGGRIDDSFHFIYLVAHTAKHIVNGGCGFRQICDLAVCLPHIDTDYVRKELKKIGLLAFAESMLDFARRAFGISIPFGEGRVGDELYGEIAGMLFDGTFGKTEKEGPELLAAQMKHSGGSSVGAAFTLTLRRIFPSYSNMWYVEQYSFLKGKPWLLPVGWVYRWFYLLFHRENVQSVSSSDLAPAAQKNVFFAKIGL